MSNTVLDAGLVSSSETTINDKKWAGFWIRVSATLIDFLVYLPFAGLNIYNTYHFKSIPVQIIIDLVMIAYKPVMEYRYGATLGKMALRIKVVNTEFERISLSQAIIRYTPWLIGQIVTLISTVILFINPDFVNATNMFEVGTLKKEIISPLFDLLTSLFLLASCLTVAFSVRKQGLHDMMAKTYCIINYKYTEDTDEE